MQYISHSVEDTQLFAKEQALDLTRRAEGAPLVIALEGDLGAGKTTFTQAFTKALGVSEKVKSPTFVLMKKYDLADVPGYSKLYHLDCYRLHGPVELQPLGIEEIFKKPGAIILIEWAERIENILPAKHVTIRFEHVSELQRNISVS